MVTQEQLDADMLEVLEHHLESRRELLKKVKGELLGLRPRPTITGVYVHKEDITALMDRFIAYEAAKDKAHANQ